MHSKLIAIVVFVGLLAACAEPQRPEIRIDIPQIPEKTTLPPPMVSAPPDSTASGAYNDSNAGKMVMAPPKAAKKPAGIIAYNVLPGSVLKPSYAISNFRPPKKNVKAVTVPYRRFLLHGKGENVLRDPELKAFVIFTHRPQNDAELKIYQAVCRQWVADFEDYASAVETARYLPLAKLTPFYWPTRDKEVTSGDCDSLYNYDYAFASAVATLVGASMQSVGPILALQQSGSWLSLDISKFEPIDVQRAFLVWKTQIVSVDPLSAKFTFVKFREYFRTLVNLYGESIVKYVKTG